jgi:phosphate transport system substrate-binding protein
MKRFLATGLLGVFSTYAAQTQTGISGAGSTFDYPVFSAWFSAYAKTDPSSAFTYQPIGSGGGINQIVARKVDFGASDAPMTNDALAEAPGAIFHVPIVTGGVAIVYNLLDGPKLRLDANTLAGIFMGTITKWNDPRIAALNPDVELPDFDVVVVHRIDSSGTTYILTDYLCSVSSTWKSLFGKSTIVNWPVGRGVTGNAGVANQVSQIPGAIGYTELSYAKKKQLQYADLKNDAGNYVPPTSASVTAALAMAMVSWDFRFSMVNSIGKDAYPICSASWVLIYKEQPDAEKGRKLVRFLRWAVTDGQKISASMDYGPLTENMVRQILQRLDEVNFGGRTPNPK